MGLSHSLWGSRGAGGGGGGEGGGIASFAFLVFFFPATVTDFWAKCQCLKQKQQLGYVGGL